MALLHLTFLNCFVPTLPSEISGHLIRCSYIYRDLSGSSEGTELFPLLPLSCGMNCLHTLDYRLHCLLLKLILKLIYTLWPSTQHETLILSILMFVLIVCLFSSLTIFIYLVYSTLYLLWLFLKCLINKAWWWWWWWWWLCEGTHLTKTVHYCLHTLSQLLPVVVFNYMKCLTVHHPCNEIEMFTGFLYSNVYGYYLCYCGERET